MFESKTPANIEDFTLADVCNYVRDRENSSLPSKRVRMRYIEMLFDVLGLELSEDLALAMLAEPNYLLYVATAGGGKTSCSQVKAILQKLIRPARYRSGEKIAGHKILCLVYNTHNVSDMEKKHRELVARLHVASIKGLDIDDKINACTMHSFCDFWRRQYVAKMDLVNCTLLKDSARIALMSNAIRIAFKKLKLGDFETVNLNNLLSLYDLKLESLTSLEQLKGHAKFTDLNLKIEVVEEIFNVFNNAKRRSRKYDFIDILHKFHELLETDLAVKERVQSYYEYVIADEVQDFTPLMWSILHLLVDNETPLTCVGDEDQNIYKFKGADIKDILGFSKTFVDGEAYLLNQNRRCKGEILAEAKRVINENVLRFNKTINGSKPGGMVKYVPYNSVDGQIISVVNIMKKMSDDELEATVLCYRNTESSLLLTELLAQEEIPFNLISGYQPYSHELYRHLSDIFDLLEMPRDRRSFINLYKIVPCAKEKIFQVFGYNSSTSKFDTEDAHLHFTEYPYGDLLNMRGFVDAMEEVVELSKAIINVSMDEIFPRVWHLFCKYFWLFKRSKNKDEKIDDIMEERVKNFFNVSKKYKDVYTILNKRKGLCQKNTEHGAGVTVSTFHGLKGLEFKTVYALFLDNDVFPNFPMIEARAYTKEVELDLKESETRLYYVAVTRAIDTFVGYYNRENPSKYVADKLNIESHKSVICLEELNNNCEVAKDVVTINSFRDDFDEFDECPIIENKSSLIVQGQTELKKEGLDAMDAVTIQNVSKNSYLNRLLAHL